MNLTVKVDNPKPGGFTVCYSGGLDSTAVAYIMGHHYRGGIHLWTLHHNYGSLFVELSNKHVKDFKRIFGEERVHHTINNISDLFKKVTLKTFFKDLKDYKSHFIWCLGCQFSMMGKIIVYNLMNNVPRVFLCSSVGGEYAVMSMPVTIETLKEFYWEYGIKFDTPLLNHQIDKEKEREILREAGIWIGYRMRRGVHGVQPICIPGLHHIGDVLCDFHTTYPPEHVERFLRNKWLILKQYIKEQIKDKGLEIEELIEKNRSIIEESEK